MTKHIDNFFNLADAEDIVPTHEPPSDEMIDQALSRAEHLNRDADARLAMVDGRDHAEAMDQITADVLEHAKACAELAMQVEPNRSARLFEVSANMYEKAISAKTHKRDAQLKSMKLTLEQRKLDLLERKLRHDMGEQGDVIPGEATVVTSDRNVLLRQLIEVRREADSQT